VAVAAVLVAYPPLIAGEWWLVVLACGGAGLVTLGLALALRLPGVLPWGLAALGTEYAIALLLRGERVDSVAPLYGAGLFLLAELAYWSLETPVRLDPGLAILRAGRLGIVTLVAGGASAFVLAVSELATHGGLLLEGLGVAALGAALALVAALARRHALPDRGVRRR
jgi:hypothetical protein